MTLCSIPVHYFNLQVEMFWPVLFYSKQILQWTFDKNVFQNLIKSFRNLLFYYLSSWDGVFILRVPIFEKQVWLFLDILWFNLISYMNCEHCISTVDVELFMVWVNCGVWWTTFEEMKLIYIYIYGWIFFLIWWKINLSRNTQWSRELYHNFLFNNILMRKTSLMQRNQIRQIETLHHGQKFI